jgi:hypothetical protein
VPGAGAAADPAADFDGLGMRIVTMTCDTPSLRSLRHPAYDKASGAERQEAAMAMEQTRPRPDEPRASGREDGGMWRDRIVELHVLAEHGDVDAADAARRWLATDGEARRLWQEVDKDCRSIQGVPSER